MKTFFGLFLISSLAFFGMSAFTNSADGYKVGDKANDFKLQNVDGEWVSLSDYKDQNGVIVIFTCNTCPYAKMYEDRIIALNDKYAPKGYPVIAINPNDPDIVEGDSFDAMKTRAGEKSYTFPYLFDAKQEVYPMFGAERTPHVFLLDSDWIVRYIGAIDDNAQRADSVEEHYLEDAIEAIEEGEEPDPNVTKAIGCTIKVKS